MYISYFLCSFHLRWVANFQWIMGFRRLMAFDSISIVLSLYSTRTQNYWRWVLLRRLTQKIVLLRYLTQKIPTCWYFWRWVRHIFRVLPDAKPKSCVLPDANPRRQPVEYRWRWVLALGLCVGHVHFIFFVLISFAFCSRRKPVFRWNMG